jgi:hypothetical protein
MKKLLLLLLLPISVLGQMTYTQTLTTYSYESTAGTSLTLGDDQTIPNLPIGFTFNYWGTNYTSVMVLRITLWVMEFMQTQWIYFQYQTILLGIKP